jgi:hypothetical protein
MLKAALLALALPALLAGCLAGAPPAHVATGQIDGAVVDHMLRPFANQTVYLSELGWTDSTSALGGFTFRNVPVGSYLLIAARPGTQGASVAVTVEEGRITKTILQMMPTPVRQPSIVFLPPHTGFADYASPGAECTGCAWTVDLEAEHPAEVFLDAKWDPALLGGNDLRITITDDRGDLLYRGVGAPEFKASVLGIDIPAEATTLQVRAWFGPDFTPRTDFRMDTYMTMSYGATMAEMLGQ